MVFKLISTKWENLISHGIMHVRFLPDFHDPSYRGKNRDSSRTSMGTIVPKDDANCSYYLVSSFSDLKSKAVHHETAHRDKLDVGSDVAWTRNWL